MNMVLEHQASCRRSAVADVVQAWRRGRACGAGLVGGLLRFARNDAFGMRDCFALLAMTDLFATR
jgi:hypothetical protein